jgi:probable phosphoglycerate mutase
MSRRVYLVRHGETEWSVDRRHTGRTDLPLNAEGRRRATDLRPRLAKLADVERALVLVSPLARAVETCELAGLGERAETVDDLLEWDYGEFEGTRTADLRVADPAWSIWTAAITQGETLDDVAARADRVVARVGAASEPVVLLFAHAHLLRILAARWCGLAARVGEHLTLLPASISMLGYEREVRVIEHWNTAAFPS